MLRQQHAVLRPLSLKAEKPGISAIPGFQFYKKRRVSDVLRFFTAKPLNDVIVEHAAELTTDMIAGEGNPVLAVHINRGLGFFEGTGQRNADIGIFRLTRAVYNATHYSYVHILNTGVHIPPNRHHFADVPLNFVGELLKVGAFGAAAARAGRNLRDEIPDAKRLQNLLTDPHLFGAIATGHGCK